MSAWKELEVKEDEADEFAFKQPWGTFPPNALQRILLAITHNSILQRGALRKMMAKAIISLSSPLDIQFRDCKFRVTVIGNLIERGMLTRPSYNSKEIEFLGACVREGGCFVDIGCNIGLYSVPLARAAGPDGRVLAIDPNRGVLRRLSFNADASGLKNITIVNKAIGASDGLVNLQITKDDVAVVRVDENPEGQIRMRSLLDVLADHDIEKVDGLKIDIEGYEDTALVPYLQNAPTDALPSRIVIERASKTADYPGCVAEFERLGYQLRGRTRNNSMYERVT